MFTENGKTNAMTTSMTILFRLFNLQMLASKNINNFLNVTPLLEVFIFTFLRKLLCQPWYLDKY